MTTSRPVVVLSPGSVGDLAFLRLVSAGGRVRCSRAIRRPGPDPAGRVLRRLRSSPGGEPVHVGIVYARDLWLVDRKDHNQDEVVARWLSEGVRIIVLRREQFTDRGLSRAVCGRIELLPPAPVRVEGHQIVLEAEHAELVWDWTSRVAPEAQVVTFEQDLVDPAHRQATADRLADWLQVPGWRAPREDDLPTAEALWSRVLDPASVRAQAGLLSAS